MIKQSLIVGFFLLTSIAKGIIPEKEYKWTPADRGLAYQESQVITPDNYAINVWEYALPESTLPTKTVIFVGTDAGNMSYSIWQAKLFIDKGIRVISFDYRGFGKSADFGINKDFLFYPEFAVDLDTVIGETRKKYPTDEIGLYALSMGTHISLLRREKVAFLIAEGFYHNPEKLVERIKLSKGKSTLLPTSSKTIRKQSEPTPTIIFCASNDAVTTTQDAKDFAKENAISIIEFTGDHLDGIHALTKEEFGDQYMEKIQSFFFDNKL